MKFGQAVWLQRGGHVAPKPGQLRKVKATYIGAYGHQVICRLEQNDPDAVAGWNKKGDVGNWGRCCISPRGGKP